MTWGAALFSIGGEGEVGVVGEKNAFPSVDSVEAVKNKIASDLSLGLGKIVGNSTDSDGSCKRFLTFSLNGDGADELKVFPMHGRVSNDNSSPDGLLRGDSLNFLWSIGGGDVQAVGSRLLLDAAGVMKDCGNADEDILFVIAGKKRSSNEVMGLSLSLISVNIYYF